MVRRHYLYKEWIALHCSWQIKKIFIFRMFANLGNEEKYIILFVRKGQTTYLRRNTPGIGEHFENHVWRLRNLTLRSHRTHDFFFSLLFIHACFASISVHIFYFKSFRRHSIVSNSPTWFIKSNWFEFMNPQEEFETIV